MKRKILNTVLVVAGIAFVFIALVNVYRRYTWGFLEPYSSSMGRITLPSAVAALSGVLFLFFDSQQLVVRVQRITGTVTGSRKAAICSFLVGSMCLLATLVLDARSCPSRWTAFIDEAFLRGEQDDFAAAKQQIKEASEASADEAALLSLAVEVFERRAAESHKAQYLGRSMIMSLGAKIGRAKTGARCEGTAKLLDFAFAETKALEGNIQEEQKSGDGVLNLKEARDLFRGIESYDSKWMTPRWKKSAALSGANTWFYQHNYTQAVNAFKSIIENSEKSAGRSAAQGNMVLALILCDRYDEALEKAGVAMSELEEKAREYPTIYCSLVQYMMIAYLAQGNAVAALRECENQLRAAAILPDEGINYQNALTLLVVGKEEEFEKSVTGSTQIAEPQRDLLIGLYLLKRNDRGNALTRLRRYVSWPEDLGIEDQRIYQMLFIEFEKTGLTKSNEIRSILARLVPAPSQQPPAAGK